MPGLPPGRGAGLVASHHAKAMAPADAQSVRGNFDNTQFRHQGVTTRFFRRDGKYFVHTDGPDGQVWPTSKSSTASATNRCSST